METFKASLKGLSATWPRWRCPCSLQKGWIGWPLKVPSNSILLSQKYHFTQLIILLLSFPYVLSGSKCVKWSSWNKELLEVMQLIAEKDDGSRQKIADINCPPAQSHASGLQGVPSALWLPGPLQTSCSQGWFFEKSGGGCPSIFARNSDGAGPLHEMRDWRESCSSLWWLCIVTITCFLTSLCFWFLIFSWTESSSPGCRLLLCVLTSWKEKT